MGGFMYTRSLRIAALLFGLAMQAIFSSACGAEVMVTIKAVDLKPNSAVIFEKFAIALPSERKSFVVGKEYRVLPRGDTGEGSKFKVEIVNNVTQVTILSDPQGYLSADGDTLTVTGQKVELYLNALNGSAYLYQTGLGSKGRLKAGENKWDLIPGQYHLHVYGLNQRIGSFKIDGEGQIALQGHRPFLRVDKNKLRMIGNHMRILTPTAGDYRLESIIPLAIKNTFKLLPGGYQVKHKDGEAHDFELLVNGDCDRNTLEFADSGVDLACGIGSISTSVKAETVQIPGGPDRYTRYTLACPQSHPHAVSGDAWLRSKWIRLSGSRPLADKAGWEFRIYNPVRPSKLADLSVTCLSTEGDD
jgi:hypothetical protein